MFNSVLIALKSLLGNKVRSALTLLGVICGVASVVIVLSVSEGLKKDMEKTFEDLGTNIVEVFPNYSAKARKSIRFSMADIELLKARCPSAELFSPNVGREWTATYGRSSESANVNGVLPDFFKVRKTNKVAIGQEISRSDVDQKRRVAVIGSGIVEKLFQGRSVLGRDIRINRITFTVIGYMEKKEENYYWGDNIILIPLPVAQKMIGSDEFWGFDVKARSAEAVPNLKDEIRLALMRDRGFTPAEAQELIQIYDAGAWQKESRQMIHTIVIFLGVIGGISLLIGGIGIMNIMLVSVMERIREIGIRKAVGATEFDIMFQFIVEAVTLCVVGGLIGVALGWFGNSQLEKLPQFIKLPMSVKTCAIALSVSIAVGLISGLWPAAKAARLNPIEALRHE